MSRRKATRRGRKTQAAPNHGPAWLMLGLILGLGVAVFMNWDAVQENIATFVNKPAKTAEQKAPEWSKETKKTTKPKPEFDFYNMLTEKDKANKPSQAKPTPKPQQQQMNAQSQLQLETSEQSLSQPQTKPDRYVVQVASLSNFQDADRIRAELTMNGFEVYMQTVQNQGQTWYRINIGPFESKDLAETKQVDLKNFNYSSLLVKQ